MLLGLHFITSSDHPGWTQAKSFVSLVALVAVVSCSEDGVQQPPSPSLQPLAKLTRSFDDPPLQGQLVLTPPPDGSTWEFSIDVDHDGVIERGGVLDQLRMIDFSVDQEGVHKIVVAWTKGAVSVADTLFAIVNDAAIVNLKSFLEGSPAGSVDGVLFVSPFLYTTQQVEIQQRDSETLEVVGTLRLPENVGNSLHGLAATDDGLLYAANQHEVLEIRLPEMELIRRLSTEISSAFFIDAVESTRIYVGDRNELSIIDLNSGQVIRTRTILSGMNHFDVDHEGTRLVIARGFDDRSLLTMDAKTFAELWEVDLGNVEPHLVLFDPDGEVIYALGLSPMNEIHFFALEAQDGRLLRHLTLEPCPDSCFRSIGANPVTQLDRYTVLVSLNGAYVVDVQTHLPVYRIDPVVQTCCNVASDDLTELFFARLDNAVFRVSLSKSGAD